MIKIKNYLINPNYICDIKIDFSKMYLNWEEYMPIDKCLIQIYQYNQEKPINIEYYNKSFVLRLNDNGSYSPQFNYNKILRQIGKEVFYEKYEKEFVEKMEKIIKNITDNIPKEKEYIDVENI